MKRHANHSFVSCQLYMAWVDQVNDLRIRLQLMSKQLKYTAKTLYNEIVWYDWVPNPWSKRYPVCWKGLAQEFRTGLSRVRKTILSLRQKEHLLTRPTKNNPQKVCSVMVMPSCYKVFFVLIFYISFKNQKWNRPQEILHLQ